MEIPPHVPSPIRWRFVIVSCVLWMFPFAVAVMRSERDWPSWKGLWPTIMGIILLILWVDEKSVRKAHLPRPGRAAWCFRVSVLICVMAASGMWLVTKYGEKIPGLYRRTVDGPIRPYGPNLANHKPSWTPDPNFKALIINQSRSVRDPASGGIIYESERLRFYPDGQPDAPGWVIHRGETSLRSEQGGELVPWNGEGVVRIVERMSGPIRSPDVKLRTIRYLNYTCRDWSAGRHFSGYFDGRQSGCYFGDFTFSEPGYPVKWLQITMIGFPVMLLLLAIPITARETMGLRL